SFFSPSIRGLRQASLSPGGAASIYENNNRPGSNFFPEAKRLFVADGTRPAGLDNGIKENIQSRENNGGRQEEESSTFTKALQEVEVDADSIARILKNISTKANATQIAQECSTAGREYSLLSKGVKLVGVVAFAVVACLLGGMVGTVSAAEVVANTTAVETATPLATAGLGSVLPGLLPLVIAIVGVGTIIPFLSQRFNWVKDHPYISGVELLLGALFILNILSNGPLYSSLGIFWHNVAEIYLNAGNPLPALSSYFRQILTMLFIVNLVTPILFKDGDILRRKDKFLITNGAGVVIGGITLNTINFGVDYPGLALVAPIVEGTSLLGTITGIAIVAAAYIGGSRLIKFITSLKKPKLKPHLRKWKIGEKLSNTAGKLREIKSTIQRWLQQRKEKGQVEEVGKEMEIIEVFEDEVKGFIERETPGWSPQQVEAAKRHILEVAQQKGIHPLIILETMKIISTEYNYASVPHLLQQWGPSSTKEFEAIVEAVNLAWDMLEKGEIETAEENVPEKVAAKIFMIAESMLREEENRPYEERVWSIDEIFTKRREELKRKILGEEKDGKVDIIPDKPVSGEAEIEGRRLSPELDEQIGEIKGEISEIDKKIGNIDKRSERARKRDENSFGLYDTLGRRSMGGRLKIPRLEDIVFDIDIKRLELWLEFLEDFTGEYLLIGRRIRIENARWDDIGFVAREERLILLAKVSLKEVEERGLYPVVNDTIQFLEDEASQRAEIVSSRWNPNECENQVKGVIDKLNQKVESLSESRDYWKKELRDLEGKRFKTRKVKEEIEKLRRNISRLEEEIPSLNEKIAKLEEIRRTSGKGILQSEKRANEKQEFDGGRKAVNNVKRFAEVNVAEHGEGRVVDRDRVAGERKDTGLPSNSNLGFDGGNDILKDFPCAHSYLLSDTNLLHLFSSVKNYDGGSGIDGGVLDNVISEALRGGGSEQDTYQSQTREQSKLLFQRSLQVPLPTSYLSSSLGNNPILIISKDNNPIPSLFTLYLDLSLSFKHYEGDFRVVDGGREVVKEDKANTENLRKSLR
ncbi:MAG: hypothetical protein DRP68_06970, partial [Candidatus Omnitrophota bacterium]